jgi:hypothetical protein
MIFEFSYPDIIKQCNTMTYLNVISFCLLSGCGSIEMPDEQELSQIYKLLKGTNSSRMPKNITFMSSLYKKCIPVYAAVPEVPYDFKSFRWLEKKMKRSIEPNVLAHSICCMTALATIILNGELQPENKDFIAYCLGINSIKQARFLIDFLKLGDFYYSGEDAGDNVYGEYRIILNNENPDIKTQFFAAEAISSVLELLCRNELYPKGLVPKLEKALEVLPLLCENIIENINDISSRDLSVIGLSLISILGRTDMYREAVYNTANVIGFELCERLSHTGDIARNIADESFSSFITLCNCMNFLIKLHEINDLIKYEASYLKLYDRIDSYWDRSSGLFLISGKSKQKYSFKETAAVFAALRTLRSCLTDPDLFMHVDRQLSVFYSATFISSKLFNNQFYPILQENKLELHNLGSAEKNTAPVFSEYFEVKVNKRKYHCEPGVFQAEDILLGCKYLLY